MARCAVVECGRIVTHRRKHHGQGFGRLAGRRRRPESDAAWRGPLGLAAWFVALAVWREHGIAVSAGSLTTNSLPWPGPSLWAAMVPPCKSTICLASHKPMPSPPCERLSDESTWRNAEKISVSIAAGMPGPLSRIRTIACSPRRSATSEIRPPRVVYLAALFRMLEKTCVRRRSVAIDIDRVVGHRDRQPMAMGVDARLGSLHGSGDDMTQVDRLAGAG